MKLATLHDGSRDGQLVVVARDLATAHHVSAVATRMQQLLDDWNFLSPQLEDVYAALNAGRARHAFPFDARQCMAPLPRAFGWAQAELAEPGCAEGAERAERSEDAAPRLCLRRSDALRAAHADAGAGAAGLAVASGDIAAGATAAQALEGVRLLLLYAEAPDADAGSVFAPLAVTPDELGAAWREGRVQLRLQRVLQEGRQARDGETGACSVDAAAAMRHDFGVLLAALARSQGLRAGCLVGSGPLLAPAAPAAARWRIELVGADGRSVCGAIDAAPGDGQASGTP